MAIDQKKYIDITSGVGGAASVARRELMGRMLTKSDLIAVNTVSELTLAGTLALFGSASIEYAFASKYFSFISKNITQADKISFARWADVAIAPYMVSSITLPAYTAFTALTSTGKVKVDLGGETNDVSPDFTGDTSLTDVAASMQTAVQAIVAGGTMWTAATVTYADNAFTLTGGDAGAEAIGYFTAPDSGVDLKAMFGMDSASAPFISQGAALETPVEAIARVDGISDNFGSFTFSTTLSNAEIDDIAAWVTATNYKYLYSVATTAANASALVALLSGATGTIVTLGAAATDYAEFMPMALLATTDYDRPNSVKNFMFQKFDSETPSVTTDAASDTYDAFKVNYLGTTQQAGKLIAFYQDGYMMDGADVAPYCNEIWLKDAIGTEFMNLLLAVEAIPANDTGESMGTNAIQTVLSDALGNGTIQSNKTLTSTQKAYITQVSGDSDAWFQVQSTGYWLDVVISPEVVGEVTQYIMNYTLIYSKADSVRKVEGTDILI